MRSFGDIDIMCKGMPQKGGRNLEQFLWSLFFAAKVTHIKFAVLKAKKTKTITELQIPRLLGYKLQSL